MKAFFRILLIVIIVGIFGGTIYYLYSKSRQKPVVFETTTAFQTDIIKKTVATGKVVPRQEIDVKPQVSGIIEQIYVEPGQQIKSGDLIARVKIIPNMLNLANAESRVKRAEISQQDTKRAFERQKDLFETGVVAEVEFQQYEMAYLNALEELQAAENSLQLIRDGVAKSQGESSNTLIRSTISGMILKVPVEVGNSVIETNNFNEGTTIATIADMTEMIFKGKVDESEVGNIHEGMNLILTIGAIDTMKFDARLEHISPRGLEESGAVQFEIRAAVTLAEGVFIRAGYSANADIVLDSRKDVLALKESLLIFESDSVFVEVEKEPQVFERQEVKLGLSDGLNVEILSGLTTEDKVKVQNGKTDV
ncbi:MAG: efflux RND transporter periplasmic adaptor subunit [Bacteroidales bacterium]|nr:efflux RND transporter periplasmic adaptor subunit [Bacteroidales bacterium]